MSSRKSASELAGKLNKLTSGGGWTTEPGYWQVTRDKSGNGSALIRLLPAPPSKNPDEDAEDSAFVMYHEHNFKGPTGLRYVERSLTDIKKQDKIAVENSKLWETGEKKYKDIASKRKRKKVFVSNILVINDPANKDNNGKVFKWRYGKKIIDKINAKMFPPEEMNMEAVNVFDMIDGADFMLRVREVDGFPNYDLSDFQNPKPISDKESVLQKIWESEYSLEEVLDKKYWKTEAELAARYDEVMGLTGNANREEKNSDRNEAPKNKGGGFVPSKRNTSLLPSDDDNEDTAKKNDDMVADEPPFNPDPPKKTTAPTVDEDDDEDMAFLRNLANKRK